MKIALLMSGGIDSSYCAYLLKEEGHEVVGIYLKLHDDDKKHGVNIANIEKVSQHLGIKTHIIDAKALFKEQIYDYFVRSYEQGLTPNPCAFCNPKMKFGFAFEKALEFGCEKIATGHYARVKEGHIQEAKDKSKDQSYFLFGLKREVIEKIIFPLGEMKKEEIKPIALEKLPWLGSLESYKDSQEICFVTDTYIDILQKHLNVDQKGLIKDTSGKVIGEHKGYMHYTIGKRKGLTINGAHDPHFVVGIDAKTNTVIAGKKEELLQKRVVAQNFSLAEDFKEGTYGVKVRYRSPQVKAHVKIEGDKIITELEEGVYGLASGQALVVYQNDLVLGGGWIEA
ncbi:tRNA 2-thiouridine(34) synthase MnmA [Sulfurospirillum deleyianum]|uniref:tRNA-specific 2-thiouridylase MnmA n=1 Tax=Sulfurospirillum deleyianum (strain ATCC 51133 / DSM 6946 / 5175) TaxID=525898 RepID=D1B520_SULD5|nr:tRNA 2-thiouridine(34) synthase MnmA [Sulfurospirillum deleyianum]ACZ13190.1 tRNA(5-methylaminomethyl-2-thiouridylate)-methyl transferase [Sulfurospirillum deleyianum DSM 6946]